MGYYRHLNFKRILNNNYSKCFLDEEILNFQIILVLRQNVQYIMFYDGNNNAAETSSCPHRWGTIGIRIGYDWHGELTKILVEQNIGW